MINGKSNPELIDVFIDGAMRATALHAREHRVEADADVIIQPLRTEIATQYQALMSAMKEAAAAADGSVQTVISMTPDWMLRDLTNSYINLAAVNALRAAGYIKAEEAK